MSYAASGFLRSGNWRAEAPDLLGALGLATGVDRIWVFENGTGPDGALIASQRFEWTGPGIVAQVDNPALQDLPFEAAGFGRWATVLGAGDPVVGHVSGFPPREREFLAAQDILSLLVVPIMVDGAWWGFMGFDDCFSGRDWAPGEVDALTAAAGALAAAIYREQAEEALRRQAEQLESARRLEAIGKLAGGIAHDFNNLLFVMRGHTELLVDRLGPDDPLREDAEGVALAIERATKLTSQLLAFGRRQLLAPTRVELNQVVRGLHGMLRRLTPAAVELRLALDPDPLWILVDEGQLEQVVVNLVTNARDALPRGGTITIGSGAEPGPGGRRRVLLTVADDGIGMDETTRARVFEPFFTTKSQGRGSGLGLSTVHGIVGQSGGTIQCDSEPGRGTRFRIALTEAVAAARPALVS